MNVSDFYVAPHLKLANKLEQTDNIVYEVIDRIIRECAVECRISVDDLKLQFENHFKLSPDYWAYRVKQLRKFSRWATKRLGILETPELDFSYDTEIDRQNPCTGYFSPDDGYVWIYIHNRNIVDICRTIFHELVHVRQHELNMITPGCSYPGAPLEVMADALAGKFIKIYGKQNPEIYE